MVYRGVYSLFVFQETRQLATKLPHLHVIQYRSYRISNYKCAGTLLNGQVTKLTVLHGNESAS